MDRTTERNRRECRKRPSSRRDCVPMGMGRTERLDGTDDDGLEGGKRRQVVQLDG